MPVELARGISGGGIEPADETPAHLSLTDTIDLQADFLVERLRDALPKMLAAAPAGERAKIEQHFNQLASRAQGCYALIDYVNFKGEGVLETERYEGAAGDCCRCWKECRTIRALRRSVNLPTPRSGSCASG